ncbi:MAG: VOC family protein [Pseudomonadota bacterium]
MQPVPYLFFNGNCADALNFYQSTLGAELEFQIKAGDMPGMDVPEESSDQIAHATLKIGDGQIMMSDSIFEPAPAMAGSSVMKSFATVAEAQPVFEALSDGAAIEMPFAPTFWSAGFGTLTDKFGVKWMIGSDEMPES